MNLYFDKNEFVKAFQKKTKQFAVDVIKLIRNLETNNETRVISFQLIKSCTSVGANYRAACKSRSRNEFFAKISIVVEEIDESLYWLEIIQELNLFKDRIEFKRIYSEGLEILKVMTTAKNKKYI